MIIFHRAGRHEFNQESLKDEQGNKIGQQNKGVFAEFWVQRLRVTTYLLIDNVPQQVCESPCDNTGYC